MFFQHRHLFFQRRHFLILRRQQLLRPALGQHAHQPDLPAQVVTSSGQSCAEVTVVQNEGDVMIGVVVVSPGSECRK